MSNLTTIFCPHCRERIHVIQPNTEIRVNKAYHKPNCEICDEYNHKTEEHQNYEDARAITS